MGQLDNIIKDINKKYKETIAFQGDNENLTKYDLIPFSSPRLNYMLYGGLPLGRMIEFAGPEGSGKTTTALDVVGQVQRLDGRKVVYVDHENTLDMKWATKLGVDVEDLLLIRPQGQTAEQVFDIMHAIIESGEVGLIVLDSVATLVSQQIYDESYEKKAYGGIAASLTMFCNKIVPMLNKHNTMCIMINQVREDLNSQWNQFITPGGKAFKHHCSVRLAFNKGQFIDKDNKELTRGADNPAGNLVMVAIAKTKTCRSDRRTGFYTLNYINGLDSVNDTIDVALQSGIILQNGSYFSICNKESGEYKDTLNDWLQQDVDGATYVPISMKYQGRASLNKALKENIALLEFITSQITYNDSEGE